MGLFFIFLMFLFVWLAIYVMAKPKKKNTPPDQTYKPDVELGRARLVVRVMRPVETSWPSDILELLGRSGENVDLVEMNRLGIKDCFIYPEDPEADEKLIQAVVTAQAVADRLNEREERLNELHQTAQKALSRCSLS